MEKLTNFLVSLVILGGLSYAGYYGYQWIDQLMIGTQDKNAVVQAIKAKQPLKESKPDDGSVVYPADLRPDNGNEFGQLIIPKLDAVLPVLEGADEEELARGVAHVPTTVLPGEPDVSLLSGHRDTVFRKVGELKAGDKLIVKTKLGQFTYIVEKSWVVDADEKINSYGKPYLLLSTCYPFTFIGPAPQRYLILAKLENPN
jgi:sortase A